MNRHLLVFSLPLANEGSSLSSADIEDRCKELLSELELLVPALKQLRSSVITPVVTVRGGQLMADFLLISRRQYELGFGKAPSGMARLEAQVLWREYEMLRNSLVETKIQMSMIVRDMPHEPVVATDLDRDTALRKLMASKRRQKLSLGNPHEQMDIVFEDAPRALATEKEMVITSRVIKLFAKGITIDHVTLQMDSSIQGSPPRQKQFLLEFPLNQDPKPIAVRLLPHLFDRSKQRFSVRIFADPLTGDIQYFQMTTTP